MSDREIYCPLCRWRPTPLSRWVCARKIGGCGTIWNTFDTGGVCPKCGWVWEITRCPACKKFSLHKHWYHGPDSSPEEETEKEMEIEYA